MLINNKQSKIHHSLKCCDGLLDHVVAVVIVVVLLAIIRLHRTYYVRR